MAEDVAYRTIPRPVARAGPHAVSVDVVVVGGRTWRRVLLRTPWLTADDDLGAALLEACNGVPDTAPPDVSVVAVAEKVAVVTSGRAVEGDSIRTGWLARRLARAVRPVGDSLGLAVPEKMQYVVECAGRTRVLTAAAAAVVGRVTRRPGSFFRIVGSTARDVDGLRGAYPTTLLPPLQPGEAALLAHHLASRLGRPVSVVDVNDRGGTIRAVTPGGPAKDALLALLADNPLGHADQSTPVVLLQRLPDDQAPIAPPPSR